MKVQKRPKLTLIGTLGVLAGASLVTACDNDSKVDVQRARYASQADCEADWSRAGDCVFVADGAQPDSGASGASGASGSSGGGAHGGGYYGGHWYGPYYTRGGTVYHSDGNETTERVSTSHSTGVTESNVSSRSLSGKSGHGGSEGISRGGFGESAHSGGGEGGHGG